MKDRPLILNDTPGADLANTLLLRSVYRKPKPASSRISRPQEQQKAEESLQAEHTATATTAPQREQQAQEPASTASTSPDTILSQPHRYEDEVGSERLSFAYETMEEDEVPQREPVVIEIPVEEPDTATSTGVPRQAFTSHPPATRRKETRKAGTAIAVRGSAGKVVRHPISERHAMYSTPSGFGKPDLSWKKASRLRSFLRPWRKLDLEQLRALGLNQAEAYIVFGLFRGQDIAEIRIQSGIELMTLISARIRLMHKFEVTNPDRLLDVIWAMHKDQWSSSAPLQPTRAFGSDSSDGKESFTPLPRGKAITAGPKPARLRIRVRLQDLYALGLNPESAPVVRSMLKGNNIEAVSLDTGVQRERIQEIERELMDKYGAEDHQQLVNYLLKRLARKNKRTVARAGNSQTKPHQRYKVNTSGHTHHSHNKGE